MIEVARAHIARYRQPVTPRNIVFAAMLALVTLAIACAGDDDGDAPAPSATVPPYTYEDATGLGP